MVNTYSSVFALGWAFFLRDFRVHYRPAILGVVWAVAPLLSLGAALTSLSYGLKLDMQPQEAPYPLFVLSGLMVWQVFTDAVTMPQRMARRTRTLLRYVPFNYIALLIAAVYYVLFNFAMKLLVFAVAIACFLLAVPHTLPFAVGPIAVLLALGLACGALITPISLVFLDIRYSLSYLLWALFAMTPIAYPLPIEGVLRQINLANPLTYLVSVARSWMIGGTSPFTEQFLLLAPAVLGLLFLAMYFYQVKIRVGIEHIYTRTSVSEDRLRALLDVNE